MKRGFRKGFTLIELLIVLAVIAALLAVVTPIALNAVRRANLTKIASNLRNIKSAAETYITMNPTAEATTNLLGVLENGYLTTNPNGNEEDPAKYKYSAELTEDASKNITVTIEYLGGDASVEDLQKIYSEVINVGTKDAPIPGVKFEIKSW